MARMRDELIAMFTKGGEYKKRLREEAVERQCCLACHRNHVVRFLFNLAVQTSSFAQRFAFFQLYIYSKWMTELQRGTGNQFLLSLSFSLLFLGGKQTVFTTESEHHPKYLCQDSLRPSSCESYSATIIRLGNNLFHSLGFTCIYHRSTR